MWIARKLLVIGDRTAVCGAIGSAAEHRGFAVQLVDRPGSAIDHVEAFRPDVVVVDTVSPETEGRTILNALLDHGVATRIVLTSSLGLDEAYLALAAGVARFRAMRLSRVELDPSRVTELLDMLDAELPPDQSGN